MKVKIKRLYNGYASIRDYVVWDCIRKGEDILVRYQDSTMLLSVHDLLHKRFQFSPRKFKSKFDGKAYTLYDYKFEDTKKKREQTVKSAPSDFPTSLF